MKDELAYERLKWTVLDEAGFHHNSDIAYYWAARAFPGRSVEELGPLVQRVLLELLDEGLIFFHWGGWDDGCDLDPHAAERASRAEVEADLARGGDAPATEQTVWFMETKAGAAKLSSVPPETLLGHEDNVKWEELRARHPEYDRRVTEWLQATNRWVLEGGSKPEHPGTSYEDWPGRGRR